jgi:hypothetical protein
MREQPVGATFRVGGHGRRAGGRGTCRPVAGSGGGDEGWPDRRHWRCAHSPPGAGRSTVPDWRPRLGGVGLERLIGAEEHVPVSGAILGPRRTDVMSSRRLTPAPIGAMFARRC